MNWRILLLLCSSLLAACATIDDSRSPAPVERSEPTASSTAPPPPLPDVPPPPPRSEDDSQPAPAPTPAPATPTSTLMASVSEAINDGDLERAAAIVERALRISPRDAELWYELANIRYRQQLYAEAEGLARRALGFAGNDAPLRGRINELLSRIASS